MNLSDFIAHDDVDKKIEIQIDRQPGHRPLFCICGLSGAAGRIG